MKKDQSEDQKVWSQKTEQVHYTRLSFLNSAGIGCNRTAEQTDHWREFSTKEQW